MTQPPVALCDRRTIFSAPDPFDQLVVLGLLATTPYCSNRAFDTAKGNNEMVNAAAGHTLTYDGRGNLTGDGVRSYTYAADGSGRMLRAKTTGGASATYQYDPFGRRTNKTVGGVTTRFMFDSTNHEIGEYDSTGHLLRRLLSDPDFAAPIAFADAAGNISYEVTDRLGSVVATIAANDSVTNTYAYLPYGDTPSGTVSGTAFGYAGYRWDAETGTYHTATRSYDPRLGRFLQTDPIGQDGGINIYAYVRGDPLTRTDISGLWTFQLGVSFSVGITGLGTVSVSAGLAVDGQGNSGVYGSFGGGLSIASTPRVALGVSAGVSSADTIGALAGIGATQSIMASYGGVTASVDNSESKDGQKINTGTAVTVGVGTGFGYTNQITNTEVVTLGPAPPDSSSLSTDPSLSSLDSQNSVSTPVNNASVSPATIAPMSQPAPETQPQTGSGS